MVRLAIFNPETRAAADSVSVPVNSVFAPVSSNVVIVVFVELTVGLSAYTPGCTITVRETAVNKVKALVIVATGLTKVPSPVVSLPLRLLTWTSFA